ncbi:MAG: hypothetical protein KAV01_09895 [Candidatus Lokiarchaeota archaeon]|nr:hypothetical protein [Candidatus Lokiarchaeota archaeon]
MEPDKLKNAILMYYKMMGWTEEGIPTKTKLQELDVEWVSQYL